MTNEEIREKILDAMAVAWLSKEVFKDVNEYMDCVRQVKEKFQ